jgi:predicted nucleic acid-binding protein
MRVVIVDTNILFMSLRARGTKIRDTFAQEGYRFYAPNFLVTEIFKHKGKLLQQTQATEDEVNEFLAKSLRNIHFVNETFVSVGSYIEAYRLCGDVDEKDTPFVALTLELEGELWTRDQQLIQGLTRKGFTAFFEDSGA